MTTTIIVSGRRNISEVFLEELVGDFPINEIEGVIITGHRYEVRLKNGDIYKIMSPTKEYFLGLQDIIIYAHSYTLTREFIDFLLSRRFEIRLFEI